MFMKSMGLATSVFVAVFTGCATSPGSSSCPPATLQINPAIATADHMAASPGNQQQFYETYIAGGNCAAPAIAVEGPLTSSDPTRVTVTSSGLATCIGATDGAVTLSSAQTKATAQITCK